MNNLNGFLSNFNSIWIKFNLNSNDELNRFANQVGSKWERLTSSFLFSKEQENQEEINDQEVFSNKRSLDFPKIIFDSRIFAKSILPFLAFKDHFSCLSVSKSWNASILQDTRFNPLPFIPQEIFSNSILSLLNFKDLCSSLTVAKEWNKCIVKYQIDKQATFKDLVKLQYECNKQLERERHSSNGLGGIGIKFECKQPIKFLENKMRHLIKQGHFQELKNVLCEMCVTHVSPFSMRDDILLRSPRLNATTICFDFLISQSLGNHLFKDALDLILKKTKNIDKINWLTFLLTEDLKNLRRKIIPYFLEQDLRNDELGKRLLSLIKSIEKGVLELISDVETELINGLYQSDIKDCSYLFNIGIDSEQEIIGLIYNIFKINIFNSFIKECMLPFLSSLLNQAAEKDYFSSLGTSIIEHSKITVALREKRKILIQLMKKKIEKSINFLKECEQKHPGAVPDLREMILNYESQFHDTLRQLFDEGEKQAHYFGDSFS